MSNEFFPKPYLKVLDGVEAILENYTPKEVTDRDLEEYLKRLNDKVAKDYKDRGFEKNIHGEEMKPPVVTAQRGSKYIRLVRDGSAYGFIEKATGNVLKSAGWKVPAKGPRGNIFDEHGGVGRARWTGFEYNK